MTRILRLSGSLAGEGDANTSISSLGTLHLLYILRAGRRAQCSVRRFSKKLLDVIDVYRPFPSELDAGNISFLMTLNEDIYEFHRALKRTDQGEP